jgi:hypothetical protein
VMCADNLCITVHALQCSTKYHSRGESGTVTGFSRHFRFSPSLLFHQCSILISNSFSIGILYSYNLATASVHAVGIVAEAQETSLRCRSGFSFAPVGYCNIII